MQFNVTTPAEYLKALENDWRQEKLHELRKMILSKAPDIIESIQYKMLAYGNSLDTVFHLNAQKNYVSLYVGDKNKIDGDGSLLKGLDVGKGCIRFKKSDALTDTRIDEFIQHTLDLWRKGEDTSC